MSAPPKLWNPGMHKPMDAEQTAKWVTRTDRGTTRLKEYHPQWERALKRYAEAKVDKAKTDINALLDYRHVESKKSALFHRTPDVTLLPIDPPDPQTPIAQVLPWRQKFLNHELGSKGANAKRALHKTLIDALAASGFLIVKMGIDSVNLPDPLSQQQIPIWSKRFISQVSSKKLVLPEDFTDTEYDAAPFLAVRGVMPLVQAKQKQWALPSDFEGSTQADESVYQHAEAKPQSEAVVEYTEIWYRASLYDADVFHPELYRCLVLVKGVETAVWWCDSPFQDLTPQGQLTDDSMIGSPIHVGTLRDLIDSPLVPSDLVVGEQLSTELNNFRTDLVKNRRQRRPITLVSDALGKDLAEKILKDHGAVVPAQHIQQGGQQDLVVVVQAGSEPRDNYTAQQIIENDHDQALGQSPAQRGSLDSKKRTATEIRTVAGNANAREETEKDRIREYFVALVRKFDVIVQRTATPQEVAKVLGQQGAALWQQWQKLPGIYGYDILPDSGRYVDAREYLTHTLDTYNLLRKDPRVNPDELLAIVARALQRDPAKFIVPEQQKHAEAPNASIAFKGEDTLNPAMGNLLLDLLANAGLTLRPETIASFAQQHAALQLQAATGGLVPTRATPETHGGSADRTEPVNQHQTQKTGGVQGVGIQ